MIERLEDSLLALGKRLESDPASNLRHPAQTRMPEWFGADVHITSDFAYEPRDSIEAHNLLVRTRFALPLTWLFLEIRDTFGHLLDASNKYGFYGSLGEAALKHLAANQPETDDARPLLRAVLSEAFRSLAVLREQHALPMDSNIVIHERDAEGRQRRITPEDQN